MKSYSDELSPKLIEEYFYIQDGKILNKKKRWRSYKDQESGFINHDGYVQICFRKFKNIKGHRLAWCLYYGEWPPSDMQIDHKDGNRSNNRIENLRLISHSGNCQNSALRCDNTSGYTGVTWAPKVRLWRARCHANGKTVDFGYHKTPEDAYKAYLRGKAMMHEHQPIPRDLMDDPYI